MSFDDAYDFPDEESRYTWEYVDNLRKFAEKHGTVDEPNVQRLLAKLEAGAKERHGERKP